VQIDKIDGVKARRNAAQVQATLDRVEAVARGEENLVPPIIEAVKAYATLGEICDTLRRVFGEYQPQVIF
jgi:methylmalonyl-CoA mutase N-terminal domain/subunit